MRKKKILFLTAVCAVVSGFIFGILIHDTRPARDRGAEPAEPPIARTAPSAPAVSIVPEQDSENIAAEPVPETVPADTKPKPDATEAAEVPFIGTEVPKSPILVWWWNIWRRSASFVEGGFAGDGEGRNEHCVPTHICHENSETPERAAPPPLPELY